MMPDRNATRRLAAAALLLWAAPAAAGTCVDKGCHAGQTAYRYLHGPLAAEPLGAEGCAACHTSAGAPCTKTSKGVFKLVAERERLCTNCHAKATGSDHTDRTAGCLKCHSPHGSDRDPNLLR